MNGEFWDRYEILNIRHQTSDIRHQVSEIRNPDPASRNSRYTFIDEHQQLGAFLTTLQNILSAYNPSLPPEIIKAMAKAGITTMTPEEIKLNKNERDTMLGKHKGTKCP
ncbi:hypothetical protein [Chryseobacterium sp. OSA05B]|uniref:hypothetical protein n=1 Tax=Chryseobacterium sp. OSA05B TaxID=2862650 RepID=UPI001CBD53AE|nr:hypothetical protein [Chryseobacterium sp. OSA05B]